MKWSKITLVILAVISLFVSGLVIADVPGNLNASTIALQSNKVSSTNTVGGGSSETEVNDCPETANPVDITGCPISGQIATNTDLDWYSFTAPAGAKVWAYVDTPGDSLLALYGPCIEKNSEFSPAGLCNTCALQLEVDDNDGTGNGGDASIESLNASVIAGVTLAGGTYYLRVSHPTSGATFPYNLFVVVTTAAATPEVEPNDTPATANEVFGTGQTSGVVAGSGTSTDFYKVCLAAGDVLNVNLDGDSNNDGGADHTLTLIDPTGMTVLFSTNSSNATGDPAPPAEAFSFNITVGGTYYIQVLPIVAEPNEYQIMASRCGPGTPNCAVGEQIDVTIVKTDTPDPVQANNLLTYSITATNNGTTAAADVTVTDPLPPGTVFISAAASPGSTLMTPTVGTNGTVTAIQPTVAGGGTFTVTIVVRVNCSVPNGTVLSNTATVSTTTPESDSNNNSSTATTTVTNPAPTFTNCPTAPIIAVAPPACPAGSSAVVNFATPQATDANSCPGVVVSCNPPSGGIFPVGNTTVTCTATDLAGQTATCAFTVSLFNACVQDDANPGNVILFNTFTGEYRVCCGGVLLASGVGTVLQQGCDYTLSHYPGDRRVTAKWSSATFKGSGSLQKPAGTIRCVIGDRDIRNNSCQCQ